MGRGKKGKRQRNQQQLRPNNAAAATTTTTTKLLNMDVVHESDHDDDKPDDKKLRDDASSYVNDGTPYRDCDDESLLYASHLTLHCALYRHCVPCAYKVGLFDVAQDVDFCKTIPNQRPEQCPRSIERLKQLADTTTATLTIRALEGTLGYKIGMNVLTVGDGDFSFSLALARLLLLDRNNNNDVKTTEQEASDAKGGTLIATSYESKETLQKVYPDTINDTIQELEGLGAIIHYNVDATCLEKTIPSNTITNTQFHRIVWNFPCEAVAQGQDGQNDEMERNKVLIQQFVNSARHFLEPTKGQIHINHKTKPPYNQWKIEQVAVALCEKEVKYAGRIVFDRCLFPPYIPRKALHKKSFPTHDACTFVFCSSSSSSTTTTTNDVDDQIIKKQKKSPLEGQVWDMKRSSPKAWGLVRVTPVLIHGLRSSILRATALKPPKGKKRKR